MAENNFSADLIEGYAGQFRQHAEILTGAARQLRESPIDEVEVNSTHGPDSALDRDASRIANFVASVQAAVITSCWTAPPPKPAAKKKKGPRGAA